MDRTHRRKAMAAIDRGLASAAGLTPAKKAIYRAAAEKVLEAMGPTALESWNANVELIAFYPDTESINRLARSLRPDLANAAGVRGFCVRDSSYPRLCSLHLNGGIDTGDSSSRTSSDVYAHEFAHAIDIDPDSSIRLSDDSRWLAAWDEERREICGILGFPEQCGAREGFAHFAVIAWGTPVAARRHYPGCWAFWSEQGLV